MTAPAGDASVLWSEAWWAEFLTSPAVAGVAALVAAVISLVLAGRRIRVDRELAAEQQSEARRAAERRRDAALDDARADRWWAMYQWVLSRMEGPDRLDTERAERLLDALRNRAPGESERALVLIAGDLLATTDGGDDDA